MLVTKAMVMKLVMKAAAVAPVVAVLAVVLDCLFTLDCTGERDGRRAGLNPRHLR